MVYPGYQLNPGDMFQVDPDRVLTATGRQRPSITNKPEKEAAAEEAEEEPEAPVEEQASADAEVEAAAKEAVADAADAEADAAEKAKEDEVASPELAKEREYVRLKAIFNQAKTVLEGNKEDLSAKRKQEIRSLIKSVKAEMSRLRRQDDSVEESQSTVDNLVTLMSRLQLSTSTARKARAGAEKQEGAELENYHLDNQRLSGLRDNRWVKDHDEFQDNPCGQEQALLDALAASPIHGAVRLYPAIPRGEPEHLCGRLSAASGREEGQCRGTDAVPI